MKKKRELTAVEAEECRALKEIYRRKRAELKLSQEDIGEALGITQSGVSMYMNGRNALNLNVAIKFAQLFSVTIASFSPRLAREWVRMFRGKGPVAPVEHPDQVTIYMPGVEPNAEMVGELDAWDDGDALEPDEVEVPYFAEVEFAGGSGMTEVVEVADRKLRFSKLTLKSAGVDPRSAAVARIKGRSMERLILDGAAIGFDMSDTSIYDGEIYAFNHSGMLRTKYLFRLPGGAIRIRSENTSEYPDEFMTADQWHDEVRMLGRVFWWSTVRKAPRG